MTDKQEVSLFLNTVNIVMIFILLIVLATKIKTLRHRVDTLEQQVQELKDK